MGRERVKVTEVPERDEGSTGFTVIQWSSPHAPDNFEVIVELGGDVDFEAEGIAIAAVEEYRSMICAGKDARIAELEKEMRRRSPEMARHLEIAVTEMNEKLVSRTLLLTASAKTNAELRKALRAAVIHGPSYCVKDVHPHPIEYVLTCNRCGLQWEESCAEHHAPGCLAAIPQKEGTDVL